MEKRALLAIVLSLLILVIYQEWVTRQYGTPPPPPAPAPKVEKKLEKAVSESPKPPPQFHEAPKAGLAPQVPVREVRVETDYYVALFTSQGARLKSFILKRYRTSVDKKSAPFEMVLTRPGAPLPLGIELKGAQPFNDEGLVYTVQGENLKLTGEAQGTLVFQGESPAGTRLTKRFTFTGSSYPIQLELFVQGARENSTPQIVLSSRGNFEESHPDVVFEGLLAQVDDKIKREAVADLKEGKELSGHVSWAGFGYTYFLFALLPENNGEQKISVRQSGPALVMGLRAPENGAAPKSSYTLFIGPKELDLLKSLGRGLENAVDFGYFGFIAVPFLYVMHFSHRFTGSYGIDIILLTILMKLFTAPLTHKSYVSMKQMQKLQPQMEKLKQKFQNDREKLNKEIMELYRRNKVNPLGGCLPMLVQFPIFIGLYNALYTPIELRHAPFMWIKDLSRPDWESLPFTVGDWTLGVPVLTLLMGASMFLQQWMTPTAGDPNQRRLMLMMPIVFTAMFVTFPAGLTTYWLVNNILSIGQQYMINRMHR